MLCFCCNKTMINENDIINAKIDGVEKTCIRIGGDEFGLPKHLMQGEKKASYIYKDGKLTQYYWEGLTSINGNKYVYFSPINLIPIMAIGTYERENALSILASFANALLLIPKDEITLESGIIPLWRLYIIKDGGVLILGEDLSNIFSVMREDKERREEVVDFLKKGTEKGFTLISQFTQLLYYSLTTDIPYSDDNVRSYNYKEIPLSFYREGFKNLDEKTIGFINFVLHAKPLEMRDISGNKTAVENLSWFVSRTENLSWNVLNQDKNESDAIKDKVKNSKEYQNFWEKTEKGARRNRFWRVKGTIIIVSVIIASFTLGFGIPYVKSFFDPPLTKLLEPVDIIYAFYDGQNSLDIQKMTTALKSAKAPQENEVINLFVTTRMRYAHEGFEPVVRADSWLEEGKKAIYEQSFIYGVTNLEITKNGESSFIAKGIWYTPYAYDEDDDKNEMIDGKTVYKYSVTQRFTFTFNKRGWYNITGLETVESEYLGTEIIETYSLL